MDDVRNEHNARQKNRVKELVEDPMRLMLKV